MPRRPAGPAVRRYATFLSLALGREAIDRFGLPLPHCFIWGDDVELTSRVLRHLPSLDAGAVIG